MSHRFFGWLFVVTVAAFHAGFAGDLGAATPIQHTTVPRTSEPSEAAPSRATPPQKDPFSRLFQEPAIPQTPPERQAPPDPDPGLKTPADQARVVCGLRVIPVDPTVDPKMRIAVPDTGIDYKIRRIQPPVCKE
jgi:hypothetical protein